MRPTGIASWATLGLPGQITQPASDKIAIGWSGAERPSAQVFNWLFYNLAEWVRRESYDWIVRDDFVRGPHLHFVQGNTSLAPFWSSTGTIGPQPAQDAANGGIGVMQLTQNASGLKAIMEARVGGIGSRDVAFETVVRYLENSGSTNSIAEFGLLDKMWFKHTGSSGHMHFMWTPSGGGATGINLGIFPVSPTHQYRWEFERQGSTMVVNVDGARKAVVGGAQPELDVFDTHVGYRLTLGATNFVTAYIDSIALGVRRT